MKTYIVVLALIFSGCAIAADSNGPAAQKLEIQTEGKVLSLKGPLFKPSTDQVIELVNSNRFDTLRIDSRGGELVAAMELGKAIHAHGLAVIVTHACNSSCANYIFPAGSKRKIEDGGFVLWHGDARQRNFAERFEKLSSKEQLVGRDGLTLAERHSIDYARRTFDMQDAFYKAVGIDGRIARIGQEISRPVSLWALSKEDMAKFGLVGIDAPSDYASPSYCERWSGTHVTTSPIHCLKLSAQDFEKVSD